MLKFCALLMVGATAAACSRDVFLPADDAGSSTDAGDAGSPADAGSSPDARSDAPSFAGPGLACGAEICRPREQVCCVTPADGGSLASVFAATTLAGAHCVAIGRCLQPAIPVECATPSFCADTVDASTICCVHHDKTAGRFLRTDCVPHSGCDESGPNDVLCDLNAPATCTSVRPNCHPESSTVQFDVFGICQ